jgi:hypothetical protein
MFKVSAIEMNMASCNLYKFYKVSGGVSVSKSQGCIGHSEVEKEHWGWNGLVLLLVTPITNTFSTEPTEKIYLFSNSDFLLRLASCIINLRVSSNVRTDPQQTDIYKN